MTHLIFPSKIGTGNRTGNLPGFSSGNLNSQIPSLKVNGDTQAKGRMVFLSNVPTADIDEFFPQEMHAMVRHARENDGWIAFDPFDIRGKAIGQLIAVPYTGQEIIYRRSHFLKKELAITRHVAEELGPDVIGLGSLMTSIAHGGVDVANFVDDNEWKLRVTTGDAGDVVAIADGLRRLGVNSRHHIGVIGPGLVGSWLATHTPRWGNQTTLFGEPRHERQMQRLAEVVRADLKAVENLRVTMNLGLLAECDVVVITTSRGDFAPEMFKPGTVIMDPAIPRAITEGRQWRDRGVPVITNAGQMSVPGANVGLEWGTESDPSSPTYAPTLYGCAAETAQYAIHRHDEHNVGHMNDDMVRRCTQWFQETEGWGHADPRMWTESAFEPIAEAGWNWVSTSDHSGVSLFSSAAH